MTAKHRQKHYKQNQKSFITCMFTHKEFVLMTGASSAEESTDMHNSADIYRNNTEGMEYNTNIYKKRN